MSLVKDQLHLIQKWANETKPNYDIQKQHLTQGNYYSHPLSLSSPLTFNKKKIEKVGGHQTLQKWE